MLNWRVGPCVPTQIHLVAFRVNFANHVWMVLLRCACLLLLVVPFACGGIVEDSGIVGTGGGTGTGTGGSAVIGTGGSPVAGTGGRAVVGSGGAGSSVMTSCEAYCQRNLACQQSESGCVSECNKSREDFAQGCTAQFDALLLCTSACEADPLRYCSGELTAFTLCLG